MSTTATTDDNGMKLLTIEQVADILNVSKSLVYRLKDEGKIRACIIGKGAVRFREEDVAAYLDSCVVDVEVRPRKAVLPKLRHIRI
jgi:excisionase family DNA binding protein